MSISDDWTPAYLVDKIFNNLMDSNKCDSNKKQNKYIDQIVKKIKFFSIKSHAIYFEIGLKDLNHDTIKQIEYYTTDCKTTEEKYRKLDGIFTEVISIIAKQAEPMIISQIINEDVERTKRSLNEIRELVSCKWILIDGETNG